MNPLNVAFFVNYDSIPSSLQYFSSISFLDTSGTIETKHISTASKDSIGTHIVSSLITNLYHSLKDLDNKTFGLYDNKASDVSVDVNGSYINLYVNPVNSFERHHIKFYIKFVVKESEREYELIAIDTADMCKEYYLYIFGRKDKGVPAEFIKKVQPSYAFRVDEMVNDIVNLFKGNGYIKSTHQVLYKDLIPSGIAVSIPLITGSQLIGELHLHVRPWRCNNEAGIESINQFAGFLLDKRKLIDEAFSNGVPVRTQHNFISLSPCAEFSDWKHRLFLDIVDRCNKSINIDNTKLETNDILVDLLKKDTVELVYKGNNTALTRIRSITVDYQTTEILFLLEN